MYTDDTEPKLCLVSVEGGPGTLETVRDSLRAGTPVVLVDGSGRATNILAFAVRHTRPPLLSKSDSNQMQLSPFEELRDKCVTHSVIFLFENCLSI